MSVRNLIGSAAILALAACATPPAPAQTDIDFVRGCWIARDPAAESRVSMLRLLPARDGSANLEGHLQAYDGAQIASNVFVTIARDGSRLTIAGPADLRSNTPSGVFNRIAAPGWFSARYPAVASFGDGRRIINIEGEPESLRISWGTGGAPTMLFDGARDGCD